MAQEIKLSPQNLDAERSVLGSVMIDHTAMDKIADKLRPEAFYDRAHSVIFQKMTTLYQSGKPIDTVTVIESFNGDEIANVGGAFYITGLYEEHASSANVRAYADIVYDKWREREIITACKRTITDIEEGESGDVEADMLSLFNKMDSTGGYESIDKLAPQVQESITRIEKDKGVVRGLRTGLSDLDRYTGGMQSTDLIIIGGRPSMGKTSLAMTIAKNCAKDRDKHIAIASIESSAVQLTERLALQQGNIDSHKYQTGYLSKEDIENMREAVTQVEGWPIWIDDSSGMSMLDIHSRTRRLNASTGVDLLVIDYLQRMGSDKRISRNEFMENCARQAKGIAKDLGVPVILVSQLSRQTEQRHGKHKRPMMSDLRDSGGIEQEADQIWLLYRPEFYDIMVDENGNSNRNKAEIIISKNRNGRTGTVDTAFIKERMAFENFLDMPDEIRYS